jgi:hypothetical protein
MAAKITPVRDDGIDRTARRYIIASSATGCSQALMFFVGKIDDIGNVVTEVAAHSYVIIGIYRFRTIARNSTAISEVGTTISAPRVLYDTLQIDCATGTGYIHAGIGVKTGVGIRIEAARPQINFDFPYRVVP